MKNNTILFTTMLVAGAILLGILQIPAHAEEGGLLSLLTSRLDVTEEQAAGGAGAIFQVAKNNLDDKQFSGISDVVPEMGKMLSAVPEVESDSGFLGSVASMFGGSEKLEGMSFLKSAFGKLGLKEEMVGMFLPIVLNYVKEKGGEKMMALLQSAVSG